MVHKCLHCLLDTWPKYAFNNFAIQNCLFGVSNLAKSSDKHKYV